MGCIAIRLPQSTHCTPDMSKPTVHVIHDSVAGTFVFPIVRLGYRPVYVLVTKP